MTELSMHTFLEGMNKDLDKGLVSNKAYLNALNMRAITTEGNTTGALENIKGTRQLAPAITSAGELSVGATYYVYNASITTDGVTYAAGDSFVATVDSFTGTGIAIQTPIEGQIIIGGVTIRDTVVIFTTNNTSATPSGGRSCIYTVELSMHSEVLTEDPLSVWNKIYDDNLNAGLATSDFLLFSTAHPIKAVGRYETENIQKVYWTDGYNPVRFIDISKNQTISGEAYSLSNRYNTVDKFNLQPNFKFNKATLSDITTGTLNAGVVQYTYQLFENNGSETTFAPLSNLIHLTAEDDFNTSDRFYEGAIGPEVNTGKGVKLYITNTNNTGFDNIRLIRLFYPTLNATPEVKVVSESSIPTDGSSFYILDSGNDIGSLTTSELINVANTNLFVAQDLATKDNRLFAANITDEVFDIEDYDSRVVRYRDYTESGATGLRDQVLLETNDADSDVTVSYVSNFVIDVEITNFPTWAGISASRSVTDLINVSVYDIYVEYEDTFGMTQGTVVSSDTDTISVTLESYIGTTATYRVTSATKVLFVDFATLIYAELGSPYYDYEYTSLGTPTIDARVQDSNLGERSIGVPTDTGVLADWDTAGWDIYDSDHDGVNEFNDPDNREDDSKQYIYQSNGSTLGAEGPNIKIGFDTEAFVLDDSTSSDSTYFSTLDSSGDSYESYASPYKMGKKSFQRGEVYRFWAVYHNNKGQASFPQWMCDLKFPSINDTGFAHTTYASFTISGVSLYPTIYFRSLPTDATSVQVYMTPRDSQDRSVYSQGYGQLITSAASSMPIEVAINTGASPGAIKLMTPEISYNKTLKTSPSDYVEHLGSYSRTNTTDTNSRIYKSTSFTASTIDSNNIAGISESRMLTVSNNAITQAFGTFSTFINYNTTIDSYGGTGLAIALDGALWTGVDGIGNLVNYRKNVFNTQYGGYTYEARTGNACYPVSEVITTTEVEHTIYGGDTFITMFEVAVFLYDLEQISGNSKATTLFIPVESTINCSLSYGDTINKGLPTFEPNSWFFRQEVASDSDGYTNGTGTYDYVQEKDMYLYNTVYSQQPTIGYKFAKPNNWVENTNFDTMIKASEVKTNGELSDSWSNFLTNNFIEVDAKHGELNAIVNYNNQLLFLQDYGFGVVAVNDRSLIQDASGAQLVLGTGGVLDRYDYISDRFGSKDKFTVVVTKAGLYWFDRIHKSLVRFTAGRVEDITRANYIKSYFDENYTYTQSAIACPDDQNDEVWFTLYSTSTGTGFTIAFNEILNSFTSFYSFLPKLYIQYHERVLSVPYDKTNMLFLHNSDISDRCNFYGYVGDDANTYYDSTLKLLFNPQYEETKAFDNLVMLTNVYSDTTDIYDETFDEVIFYNDYQCTGDVELVYKTNLERRERTWNLYIPRNIVSTSLDSHSDILASANWDATRTFKERMRDKYLIAEFTYENDGTRDKFVVSKIGVKYRKSFR